MATFKSGCRGLARRKGARLLRRSAFRLSRTEFTCYDLCVTEDLRNSGELDSGGRILTQTLVKFAPFFFIPQKLTTIGLKGRRHYG